MVLVVYNYGTSSIQLHLNMVVKAKLQIGHKGVYYNSMHSCGHHLGAVATRVLYDAIAMAVLLEHISGSRWLAIAASTIPPHPPQLLQYVMA